MNLPQLVPKHWLVEQLLMKQYLFKVRLTHVEMCFYYLPTKMNDFDLGVSSTR